MRPLFFFATAALFATTSLPAQQPSVVHAQLTTEAAPAGPQPALDHLTRSGQVAWLAYSIPTAKPFHSGSQNVATAFLEGDGSWRSSGSYSDNTTAQDHALVLFRVAGHHLTKLRVEDPTRTLDAGGLRLVLLTGVSPEQSISTLKALALAPASDSSARQLRDTAVFLISLHRSASTIPTLAAFTDPARDPELREKSAFWLATSSDPEAFHVLQQLARTDSDASFRSKLTFDLTLVKHGDTLRPEALNELIRMAHSDGSPEVRKQAQFWMGTLGGERVTADLRAAAESDPNQDVRRSAVFALSRLPAGEATPELIHVAQTSNDPDTRKQAVFWLGQSSDPKALDYLTALLKQ